MKGSEEDGYRLERGRVQVYVRYVEGGGESQDYLPTLQHYAVVIMHHDLYMWQNFQLQFQSLRQIISCFFPRRISRSFVVSHSCIQIQDVLEHLGRDKENHIKTRIRTSNMR